MEEGQRLKKRCKADAEGKDACFIFATNVPGVVEIIAEDFNKCTWLDVNGKVVQVGQIDVAFLKAKLNTFGLRFTMNDSSDPKRIVNAINAVKTCHAIWGDNITNKTPIAYITLNGHRIFHIKVGGDILLSINQSCTGDLFNYAFEMADERKRQPGFLRDLVQQ